MDKPPFGGVSSQLGEASLVCPACLPCSQRKRGGLVGTHWAVSHELLSRLGSQLFALPCKDLGCTQSMPPPLWSIQALMSQAGVVVTGEQLQPAAISSDSAHNIATRSTYTQPHSRLQEPG